MTANRRLVIYLFVLVVALLGLDGWAYWCLVDAHEAAEKTALDTKICRDHASQIRALKARPVVASATELQGNEMTQHIERAAKAAHMPSESLARISPEAAKRLAESPYMVKPTQVLLRHVTLGQLAVFLHAFVSDASGMDVESIRVSAPREQDVGEFWSAEVTLRYLVYSPKSDTALISKQ